MTYRAGRATSRFGLLDANAPSPREGKGLRVMAAYPCQFNSACMSFAAALGS